MSETEPNSLIEVVPQAPVSGIQQAISHYGTLTEYVTKVLRKDIDFGSFPGVSKPVLLKPGAEKLIQLFGLRAEFQLLSCVEDWTGESHGLKQPLFFYKYRCALYYPRMNGHVVGDGTGSANSLEKQYSGKDKHGNDRWHFGLVNTVDKIAQKRSLVASVLITCGASQFFSQDIDDWQQTVSDASDSPREKEAAIARVGELITQLGWSIEQGQSYLKQNYGVTGRKQLSLKQLSQLIEELSQMVVPKV